MFYEIGLLSVLAFASWIALAYSQGKVCGDAKKVQCASPTVRALFFTLMGTSKMFSRFGSILDVVVSFALMRFAVPQTTTGAAKVVAAPTDKVLEALASNVKRGRIAVAS